MSKMMKFISPNFIIICLALLLSGCGITSQLAQTNVELRNAVNSFDRGINALSRESADWQVVLQELQENLVEDTQSTLRVEITNLMRTGLLGAGGEFRCDADFLRIRTERELRRIRNDLVQILNSISTNVNFPLVEEIPVEPFICSAVPVAIDAGLDAERRAILDVYGYDMRSLPINAEVLDANGNRRNVTTSLGIISDQHMVLDLTEGGAAIKEDDRRVVFRWNAEPQSVIRIFTASAGKPRCETRTEEVTLDNQTFIPPHREGDKDFKGHGPCVKFTFNIVRDIERTSLYARLWMKAFECDDSFSKPKSDNTRAQGWATNVQILNLTEPGEQIIGHNMLDYTQHTYIDDDHEDDIFNFASSNYPFEQLTFVGDTDGNEAGTRTGVDVNFRTIKVTVESCQTD
jgi:hypothetical protein